MNQQYPQYPQQPPHGYPPQGPPGYYGMPPQQPPPPKGISIGRIIAGVVSGLVILGVAIFFLGTFGGRGGGTSSAPGSPMFPALQETVVINEFAPYKDGTGKTWKVEPGTYRVEMTATEDGASVEWAGASCTQAKKTTIYNTTCTVTHTSQLSVTNPTLIGLGPDITVTLKVTRLP